MCRFLLIKSKLPIKPQKLLEEFADMAEKSRAPDDDRQADGWGIGYKKVQSPPAGEAGSKFKDQSKWEVHKSLKPIWKDQDIFETIPAGNLFAVHARSASFPSQKGIIEYNQPYITDNVCFVFNGSINGIRLTQSLSGSIGAQKIFSLLNQEMQKKSPDESLKFLDQTIVQNSRIVNGLNVGLIIDDELYALCEYAQNRDYFELNYYQDETMTLVCSEPIGTYLWQTMDKGEVIKL